MTPMEAAQVAHDRWTDGPRLAEAAHWFECSTCGARFPTWGRAERHARDFGHSRVVATWIGGEG